MILKVYIAILKEELYKISEKQARIELSDYKMQRLVFPRS